MKNHDLNIMASHALVAIMKPPPVRKKPPRPPKGSHGRAVSLALIAVACTFLVALVFLHAGCSGPSKNIEVGNPLDQEGTLEGTYKSAKWGVTLNYDLAYEVASEGEDSVLFQKARSGQSKAMSAGGVADQMNGESASVLFSILNGTKPEDGVAQDGEYTVTDKFVVAGTVLVSIHAKTLDGSVPVQVAAAATTGQDAFGSETQEGADEGEGASKTLNREVMKTIQNGGLPSDFSRMQSPIPQERLDEIRRLQEFTFPRCAVCPQPPSPVPERCTCLPPRP